MPAPCRNLRVTAASTTKLTVTWSVPSDDGGYIDKYQIEASATADGAYSATGVSPSEVNFDAVRTSTVTVDAHSTERYVRVRAVNGQGNGPWTTASDTSSKSVPGAVQNLSVKGTDISRLTITWTPPADSGGSAITWYHMQSKCSPKSPRTKPGAPPLPSFPPHARMKSLDSPRATHARRACGPSTRRASAPGSRPAAPPGPSPAP